MYEEQAIDIAKKRLIVEESRRAIEQQRLDIESQRLPIEQERHDFEKERLSLERKNSRRGYYATVISCIAILISIVSVAVAFWRTISVNVKSLPTPIIIKQETVKQHSYCDQCPKNRCRHAKTSL